MSYFVKANQLLRERKFEEAVVYYQKAIEQKSDFPWYHYNLGEVLVKMGRQDEAVVAYRRALEIQPSLPGGQEKLIAVLQGMSSLAQSNGDKSEVIESESSDRIDDRLWKMWTQTTSMWKEAVDGYRQAVKLNSDSAELHYCLGLALCQSQQEEEGIACYHRAIEAQPNFFLFHHHLGDALLRQSRLYEAVAAYRQAIDLNPNFAWCHHNLGTALFKQGRIDKAMTAYRRAIELQPDLWSAKDKLEALLEQETHQNYYKLGTAWVKASDWWKEAVDGYRQAVELNSDSAELHYCLGLALCQSQQEEDGIACYHRAIELQPDFFLFYSHLGDALLHQRRCDEAVAAYRRAIELNPNSEVSNFNLGFSLLIQGRQEEAIATWHPCADSNVMQRLQDWGDWLVRQEQLDAATSIYRIALELQPDSRELSQKCAEILGKQGHWQEAMTLYRKAIELSHQSEQVEQTEIEQKESDGSTVSLSEEDDRLFNLARQHLLKEEYDEVIEKCSSIMGLHPNIKDTFPILAEAYRAKGKLPEAEILLKNTQIARYLTARDRVIKVWGPAIVNESQEQDNDRLSASNKIQTIVIYTCVWKRPELTEIVLSHYSELQQKLAGKIQLKLLAVGSEGEISSRLCESCGFDYLEAPNQPLSLKWEHGINGCAEYDPDAVIIVGSDDIISQSLIEFYDEQIKENLLLAGIKDAYFFDTLTEQMVYWTGYNNKADSRRFGETTGMGRCLSRCLLDKINFSIWKGIEINKGLDGAMTQKFLELGLNFLNYENLVLAQVNGKPCKVGHCGFYLPDIKACAVDIKTTENVTSFQRYLDRDSRSFIPQDNPWEMMAQYFPSLTIEKIKGLTQKLKA